MIIKFKKRGYAIGCNCIEKGARYWGYQYSRYDGDFYEFGFWFFHIWKVTNPSFYLTREEMDKNVEAFYVKYPNQRPKGPV